MSRKDIPIFKIRERFRIILSLREKPHHIAASFSVGVFIGMSPLLGLHTVLGLIVSSVFRLNRVVTIIGVYITNPWTIIPIYTFSTWAGMKLLGVSGIVTNIQWEYISIANVVLQLKELLIPFIVGTFFIGTISCILGYLAIYFLLRKKQDA